MPSVLCFRGNILGETDFNSLFEVLVLLKEEFVTVELNISKQHIFPTPADQILMVKSPYQNVFHNTMYPDACDIL